VDHQKNDFVEWLRTVLGDKKIAKKLKKVTSKEEMIKIIEKNIAKDSVNN